MNTIINEKEDITVAIGECNHVKGYCESFFNYTFEVRRKN